MCVSMLVITQMDIIIENVHSEKAKDLFYHMLINYEIYKSTAEIANYAQTECQFRYCGTAIPFLTVRSTAR